MLRSVFLKTLRDQRRGLVGWGTALAVLVIVEAALWPSIEDMGNLDEFLASYPEGLKELFNLDAMNSGLGFMNAELFSLMLPLLFIVYAVGRGARLIAGEEEAGSLELLLVTPASNARILIEKSAALATSLVLLGLILVSTLLVVSPVFDLGIDVAAAASGSLAMILLGLEFGCLALATGAATGRRVVAVAVAGVVAVVSYVLYAAAEFVDGLQGLRGWSPIYQAVAHGPLGGGLPIGYLWMLVGAAVLVALAVPTFNRRDIGVAH